MITNEEKQKTIQMRKECSKLKSQIDLIRAKHERRIWTDTGYDVYAYNQREKLRNADLVIALSEDTKYQELYNKLSDLQAELFYDDEPLSDDSL